MNHEQLVQSICGKISMVKDGKDIDALRGIIAKYAKLLNINELNTFRYELEAKVDSIHSIRKYFWGLPEETLYE